VEVILALAELGHYPDGLMHPLTGIQTAVMKEAPMWEPEYLVKVIHSRTLTLKP